MIEMSAEWRTFEDSSHDPRRCGGMENPHLSDGGMSTCIGNATTFGQSSRLVRTQQMQTVRPLKQPQASLSDFLLQGCSTDDLIRSHIKHVEDLSADMSLPQAHLPPPSQHQSTQFTIICYHIPLATAASLALIQSNAGCLGAGHRPTGSDAQEWLPVSLPTPALFASSC